MTQTEIPKSRSKFTVYGILAVIIILAFLLAIPGNGGGPGTMKAEANNSINNIFAASKAYRTEYGSMPRTADDKRLIRILCGDNPRKIAFLSLKTQDIDLDGKYVDPWGTPYEIITDSDFNLRATSAGPDKKFGTADDISNKL